MPKKAKEMERLILKDGWKLEAQVGAHRHYKHPKNRKKLQSPFMLVT